MMPDPDRIVSLDPDRPVEIQDKHVFVVLPAYNEEAVLGAVLEETSAVVDLRNLIVVDDGSSDETRKIAHAAGVNVVGHVVNRGQGAALATGIARALELGARVIATFDADGQHRAADLTAVVGPVLAGEVDVVLGSRFLSIEPGDMPLNRRLLLKLAVSFTRLHTGLDITDTHNGLRALSARAARMIDMTQDDMSHASQLLQQIADLGLSYREAPIFVRYSDYSLRKGQRSSNAIRILFAVMASRLRR